MDKWFCVFITAVYAAGIINFPVQILFQTLHFSFTRLVRMASAVRGAVARGARALQRASSIGGVRLHAARMPAVAAACASMPSVRAQCSRSSANVGGKSGSGWRWDGTAKSGWWGPRAAAALFGGCGFVAATYGALAVVDCEADNSDEVITSYLVPGRQLAGGLVDDPGFRD